MSLEEFLENYKGCACISIENYCDEQSYDLYPIKNEPWWNEVKDRKVTAWDIIGGGIYPVELIIEIERQVESNE